MIRDFLRFIAGGAALGTAIPLALWLIVSRSAAGPNIPAKGWEVWDYLGLMLWPVPWALMRGDGFSDPDLSSWHQLAIAVLANAVLYCLLAALLWLGVTRSKVILIAPALVLAAIWYAAWPT